MMLSKEELNMDILVVIALIAMKVAVTYLARYEVIRKSRSFSLLIG